MTEEQHQRRLASIKAWKQANRARVRASAKRCYAANRDAICARQRAQQRHLRPSYQAYVAAHADRLAAIKRRHYERHRERMIARAKAWALAHPERRRATMQAYVQRHPDRLALIRVRRRLIDKRAAPGWANQERIREIYAEAARRSVETGIAHEVDHIYPLRSRHVCGLHVESNLQILTHRENMQKANSLDRRIAV